MSSKQITILSKEELHVLLKNLKNNNHTSLKKVYSEKKETLTKKGGVYAFWWDNNSELLKKNIKQHKHQLKGRQTEEKLVDIVFTKEWLEMATANKKICIYIGKTNNIAQRIGKHIKPKTPDIWGKVKFDSGKKPNTESQLRIGVERILESKDARQEIYNNVSFTYVELDGVNNCINRFYLEDLAIGSYFPLLNIDIER